MPIVIDPLLPPAPPPALVEGLVLDGLDLQNGTTYRLLDLQIPDPPKRMEWAQAADADGSLLVRDPLVDNRVITAKVDIWAGSQDDAIAALGALVDKLEECERQADGLPLVWTEGSKQITFYVLSGEITDKPLGWDAGWQVGVPQVTLSLTCKPFGYGPEVSLVTVSNVTAPAAVVTVPGVPGDAPAEARVVVTERSGFARRYVELGMEQRYMDPSTSLLIDSQDLVTTGFAGTQATLNGSYRRSGATSDVVTCPLYIRAQAVCGTGKLGHVGTFRVKARVYLTGGFVRLSWQQGDGQFRANDWAAPVTKATFCEVDLGVVTIPPKQLGTQNWSGRIEAYASDTSSSYTCSVDYLVLVPTEVYGRARAAYPAAPGVVAAHDEFTGASGALNGRVPPTGGIWSTTGVGADFIAFSDTETRSTTSDTGPRLALLGPARTDTDIEIACSTTALYPAIPIMGIVARWANASNYIYFVIEKTAIRTNFVLYKVIAGTLIVVAAQDFASPAKMAAYLRLIVYASGRVIAYGNDGMNYIPAPFDVSIPEAATGGVLASGNAGLYDQNYTAAAANRAYDNVTVTTPAAEPIVLYANRQMEFRSDGVIRQDSTGTYYGPVPSYRGGRLLLPPAGTKNRSARVLVKADRNNIETADDLPLGDAITVEVRATPRYITVPR